MPSRKPASPAAKVQTFSQLDKTEFIAAELQADFDFVTEENQLEFKAAFLACQCELDELMNKAGVTGEFELRDKVKQKWQKQLKNNQEKAMHIVADRTTARWCMTDIMKKDWVCLMSRRLRNLCHHGFATKWHVSWMRELMGEAGDFYDPLML